MVRELKEIRYVNVPTVPLVYKRGRNSRWRESLFRLGQKADVYYGPKIVNHLGASLVAQWLRIGLLMQGTRVRALVWEDPTCRGATRPVSHSY